MAKQLPGTDEQTVKVLSEAKKGKARKFAIIYKGASVLKLIAFKKGAFKAKINAAKKEGHKGKGCWGVVNGEGPALTFYLSTEDGFDRPPIKEMVLKKFLFEEAQLKLKVTFKIVANLPTVADSDDEDEEQEEQEEQEAAAPATEAETDSDDQEDQDDQSDQEDVAVAEPDPTEFKQRLVAVMPDLKKALAAGSPLTGDLKKYADAAQKLAKAKQFDKGIEVLDKLEGLIEKALVAPAVSAAAQEVEAAPPDQDQEDQDDEAASPDEQEKEQEVEAKASDQEQEEQEPASVAAPPTPATKATEPAERDEQEIAAERDARQKDIADAYRDLPDPLKFTTLDAAAGKCAKIVSENRNTVEALDAYQDLITECVQWTRSDDAKEHKDAVATVEAMRDNATAERDATKEAIAAAAALKAKLAEEFKERLVTLLPSIMEAQGPKSPVSAEVTKLFKEVQKQGKAKDFEAGHESLDAIEVKIQEAKDAAEAAAAQEAAATATSAAEAEQEEARQQVDKAEEQEAEQEDSMDDEQMEAAEPAPVDDRTMIFRACSNDWQQGRKRLEKSLQEVEKVLLSDYAGDELFGEARDNTREIYTIMDKLDDRLCFALDDAALDGEANIKRAVKKARKISNEYISFINSDPLFNALEQDKDLPLGMKADLTSILNSISVQIT